jgi:integral membrane sensor domain MASE1
MIDSLGENTEGRMPSLWRLVAVALVLGSMDFVVLLLNLRSPKAGFTILWPGNGLLLGVLLCVPRRQWPAYLTVGFAVNLGSNLALSIPFWISTYFACCNILEVVIAALLLYRAISPRPDLTERRQLLSLLVFGVLVAPAIAALLAQLGPAGTRSLPFLTSFRLWFVADALGIATVTPLYLSFSQPGRVWNRSWQEVGALFTLLCCATVFVFWQTQSSLLFLLLPCLLLLGVRLGLAGSAMGLVLISVVGGLMGDAGHGPIMLLPSGIPVSYELLLQIFIATAMLVLYAIEVATAEAKRLQVNLQSSEMRFRLLAEASSDVIVLSNLLGERRYVSPAATTMLGWETEELVGGNYREIVHPDDIARMEALMEECRAGRLTDALDGGEHAALS